MIEKKNELITDKYTFSFVQPLEIEVDKKGGGYVLKNQKLCIRTDSIYKFAMEFEDLFFKVKQQFALLSELELEQKRYICDYLGTQVDEKKKSSKTKKKINSRAKGQRGEKLVIKALEPHFPGLNIYRTPGSGAFATTHGMASENNILSGDLLAEENNPQQFKRFIKYNWEVKNYSTLPTILELYYKKSCDLAKWIDQAERDATNNKKRFTIIFKSNYSPIYIIFKAEYAETDNMKGTPYLMCFNYCRNTYYVYLLEKVHF